MTIGDLKNIIIKNLENKTQEVKRVFHGRGNYYKNYNHLTVDSFDKIFFASFFEQKDNELDIIKSLEEISKENKYETFLVQRRYLQKSPSEVIFGKLNSQEIAIENNLKYNIDFSNKNIGLFLDMKKGREYINSIAKDKKVLNLFSYTCAFSVAAISGGAKEVVNIDMSKSALNSGRENHRINSLDTKKVKFMPYNILKSFSGIKKYAPYDIIIIDPPSFQKGSFAATKDYEKIIKRVDVLASDDCTILSCLNAPELNEEFIKDLFLKNVPMFKFQKRLDNLEEFITIDEQRSLKNLIFKKI